MLPRIDMLGEIRHHHGRWSALGDPIEGGESGALGPRRQKGGLAHTPSAIHEDELSAALSTELVEFTKFPLPINECHIL
jgi:hypothetical protein